MVFLELSGSDGDQFVAMGNRQKVRPRRGAAELRCGGVEALPKALRPAPASRIVDGRVYDPEIAV